MRPNIIDEKELLYQIKRENGMTASKIGRKFKIYFPRITEFLQRLCKEGKLRKEQLGNHVYYKVRDDEI